MQLAVADVESDDTRGASLEEDVGETARRGSDVEAFAAGRVDSECLERIR